MKILRAKPALSDRVVGRSIVIALRKDGVAVIPAVNDLPNPTTVTIDAAVTLNAAVNTCV